MRTFYCLLKDVNKDQLTISDKDQLHHIKDVLHLKSEEEVAIFDEQGNRYKAKLAELLPSYVLFNILNKEKIPLNKNKAQVTIACAIPKKSNMDDIIDKLTQLAVDRIIPLETERVIVRLDKAKRLERFRRWQKIAFSAGQQSGRSVLPIVEQIKDIKEVLSDSGSFDLKLIPSLIVKGMALKDIVCEKSYKNILVLIGPEGDFTPQEVELAKRHNFISVSLGDLVLRVETAAVAVASFFKFLTE